MLAEAPIMVIALVLVAGTLSSWLAWRFALPVVPLLLLAGGILQALGVPGISLREPTLAITLIGFGAMAMFYQGGSVLRRADLAPVKHEVQHLAAMGPKVGWVLTALAAKPILGVDLEVGFLLGALLLVGAPYAVEGIARMARAAPDTEMLLVGENYIVSCFGTAWSILVAECIMSHKGDPGVWATVRATVLTAGVGCAYGYALSRVLKWVRPSVPASMWNAVWLTLAVLAFSLSNRTFMGSGVVTAAVAGYMASRVLAVDEDERFGRDISTLMLGVLGIVVGILVPWPRLADHWPQRLAFCAFVVGLRPVLVWLACRRSPLPVTEKRILSMVAPRGILTLSIAVFVLLQLHRAGFPDSIEVVCTVWWVAMATNLLPWGLPRLLPGLVSRRAEEVG